jgi:hypothetical protein
MTITNPDEVKILVKQTINTTELANAVEAGDKRINSLTNREIDEWSPSDNAYGQLQAIGNTYAAWLILMGWDPKMYLDKAKEMRKAYEFELLEFRKLALPEDKSDPDVDIVESDYTHYKLNPNNSPFLSEY